MSAAKRIAVITLDEAGRAVADAVRDYLGAACHGCDELRSGRDGELSSLFARGFAEYGALVCVMATGIVARMIAPLAESKLRDPAVVVVDDEARWAISLLSGHEGGANALAYEVAAATGATPVVTTGTDTKKRATMGVGCRRGASKEAVMAAMRTALAAAGLAPSDLRAGASVALKRGEAGLVAAFRELGVPLFFISEEEINSYDGPYERGGAAERRLGIRAVAEPCALLAGRRTGGKAGAALVVRKTVAGPVTVAIAMEGVSAGSSAGPAESVAGAAAGSLAVVGIGPGGLDHITRAAERELATADLVVGYGLYLELIAPLIEGKERFASSMRAETERADYALEAARAGRRVAVVAGGDACVYGIGSLVLERLRDGDAFPVSVAPGVTAANAAASVVGAPLANDYMVVSLSDLLTPRSTILSRVEAAAASGVAVAFYNPRSRTRTDLLDAALRGLLDARGPDTPVAVVRDALRPGQESRVVTLAEALDASTGVIESIDMFTIVIVASPDSRIERGRIVTPRGYDKNRKREVTI